MLKLIKTTEQHAEAISRLEHSMLSDPAPGSAQADELELLAFLIAEFERHQFPIGLPDPVSAIKFRMEQAGLAPTDLVPYLGSQSRVSEVLNARRPLSLRMMRKLHEGLGIPAEVLLQPWQMEAKRPLKVAAGARLKRPRPTSPPRETPAASSRSSA